MMHTTKLLIFDGNAIMHRAYHALPPMTGSGGQPTNAVYGLVSMFLKVVTDLGPSHVAFAFDRPEPTFRKKILEEYQAHRPDMEVDLGSQFRVAQKVIKAFGIPVYDKAGYEADDVIGTIAQKIGVDEVIIVTGDRDMLQLVDKKVKLFMPIKGLSQAQMFGKEETVERMGVPPGQIIDFKALVGDPSDNYKGVPGIGPKTATRLLEDYKTLDGIYKNLDKITGRIKELLVSHKESAYQSQELARIVLDVKLNFKISDMNKWVIDSEDVIKTFNNIGFRTLTARVQKIGKDLAKQKQMSLV